LYIFEQLCSVAGIRLQRYWLHCIDGYRGVSLAVILSSCSTDAAAVAAATDTSIGERTYTHSRSSMITDIGSATDSHTDISHCHNRPTTRYPFRPLRTTALQSLCDGLRFRQLVSTESPVATDTYKRTSIKQLRWMQPCAIFTIY